MLFDNELQKERCLSMKKFLRTVALISLMSVYMIVVFTPPAFAYIDPSTTTYLIQAIAGIAVAVGSVAIIYWRKAKKKLNEKMGIDLDKNKEVEEDIIINDEEK